MTNLPGSRPVVTLYLDPAEVLRPDGGLWSFWSKFVVGFTRTFTEHRYAVVLDIADRPDPAAAIDAQSYVIAGTSGHRHIDADDMTFGQLLVAPGIDPVYAPTVSFEHDHAGIAQTMLDELADVDEILVIPRAGDHAYVQRITAELGSRIPTREVSVEDVGSAPDRCAVVSFRGDPAVVRETIARLPESVPLIVQGEPFATQRRVVFLDLLGKESGELIAGAVADALSGESAQVVALPHRLTVMGA